jgi:acetyltransferase-like isoleucine patch superfamily enzyme
VWHHAQVRAEASIGADCTLGKNVFVDAGVRIGAGCRIQNNVSVYAGVLLEDDVFVGPSAVFTNDRVPRARGEGWTQLPTTVRRGASIGANATVIAGVEIGTFAMVGAGAVVTRDVEPHELVIGNPARRSGWVCSCGEVLVRSTTDCPPINCARCGSHFDGAQ